MNSHNYKNELIYDDNDDNNDKQRYYHMRTNQCDKTTYSTVPKLYEQTITTTTTTTINKEENSATDEMTTTKLEKGPLRRVNLITGPRSAFARLFPDKYQQQQEQELGRHFRSKSSDENRYNFDRVRYQQINCDDNYRSQTIKQSRYDDEITERQDRFDVRTKSEPHLHENIRDIPLNYDPDPEIVYRDNPNKVVYVQKIGVRYLKPPTPPIPEPIIVREVPSAPPQPPPPLIVSSTPPPVPRTPSPYVIREQPPTPPQPQPARIITKKLPPLPAEARRVIIKRMPPLPPKPRPVIIEKWLPYKPPPDRPILYERAEQPIRNSSPQRNLILQYEPAHVRIEQDIQNVGCFRVDPAIYRAQYGSTLRRTDSIRKVLNDIGCNPDLIASTGSTSYHQSNSYDNHSSNYNCSQKSTTCFTDEQLEELINAPSNRSNRYERSHYKDHSYYSTIPSYV